MLAANSLSRRNRPFQLYYLNGMHALQLKRFALAFTSPNFRSICRCRCTRANKKLHLKDEDDLFKGEDDLLGTSFLQRIFRIASSAQAQNDLCTVVLFFLQDFRNIETLFCELVKNYYFAIELSRTQ